jgi:hypothetical protein
MAQRKPVSHREREERRSGGENERGKSSLLPLIERSGGVITLFVRRHNKPFSPSFLTRQPSGAASQRFEPAFTAPLVILLLLQHSRSFAAA